MIITGGCRRCGGDLALEQDQFGRYVSCIQCGREHKELTSLVAGRFGRVIERQSNDTDVALFERRVNELVAIK